VFQAIEIEKAIVHGERDGLEKRRARVFPIQREQAPQRQRAAARTPLFQRGGIRGHGRVRLGECLVLGRGLGAGTRAARRAMLGHRQARKGAPEDLRVGRDQPRPVVAIDAIFGFPDLELATDEQIGHRVAVPMHIDIALDIDEPMMERVHLRDEERQRPQVRPLGGEELARTRVQMLFVGRVDFVAEGARLGIEIDEVGKRAPGEEVVLDEMKRYMRRVAYAVISEANRYAK